MEMSFDEKLEFGKIAEKEIESYFMNKDYNIIRSYDCLCKGGEGLTQKQAALL